jgi:hypothetical protein
MELINDFSGEDFNAHAAGDFAAEVPAHAIRHRHQQSAIFKIDKCRLTILSNTTGKQGENHVVVLIVAPPAAHIGGVSGPRAQTENALLRTTRRR